MESNKNEFNYLGIKKFHEEGYTGRNVIIASRENIIEGIFDDVEAIKYEKGRNKYSIHGTNVMDYIRQVVPNARKITGECAGSIKNDIVKMPQLDFLENVQPDVLTTSQWGNNDRNEALVKKFRALYDNGCFLCTSAGNGGYKGTNTISKIEFWMSIGAAKYTAKNVYVEDFSARGEEVDFVSLDTLVSIWDGKRHYGTSFASPIFAGMVALVQDFFISNTGKKITNEKMLEFIKDNCIDLYKKGKDDDSGYGIFILPDPKDIDINKYSSGIIDITEVFDFLIKENELLEPDYWKEKIKEEDKMKWLFIKWANAVRVLRGTDKKDFSIIENYDIEKIIDKLYDLGVLLEPDYWREKINQEEKLKWLFFKWYYALKRKM